MRTIVTAAAATALALMATAGAGRPRPSLAAVATETRALDPLLACRAIAEPTARLACFDRTAAALQDATAKHDVVVVDRQEVAKVRRSLFGFGMPSLAVFGVGAKDSHDVAPEEAEITTTIRSASRDGDGNWIVTLEDGAIWHQTGGTIALGPRPGGAVTIKRGAIGSYFMKIGSQPAVKARREG